MINIGKCIICGSNDYGRVAIATKDNIIEKWEYNCKYCKKYKINESEKFLINTANDVTLWQGNNFDKKFLEKIKNNIYKLQSYIREQNDEFNNIPELTEEKIKQIIDLPNKTIKEQFDLFLLNLYKNNFNDDLEILRIKSWIKDLDIMNKIAKRAVNDNFTKLHFLMSNTFSIVENLTFDGMLYVEEKILQANQNSKKVFLAFKFSEDNKTIFTNLADKIKELELNPIIVNQDTTNHNEKIGDKIIAELKSSRILVADLTGHSQNVYYEIGYVMGMGIPVILTCHKNDIENLHFDINQYPVFEWENESELQEKIKNRIKAVL